MTGGDGMGTGEPKMLRNMAEPLRGFARDGNPGVPGRSSRSIVLSSIGICGEALGADVCAVKG